MQNCQPTGRIDSDDRMISGSQIQVQIIQALGQGRKRRGLAGMAKLEPCELN